MANNEGTENPLGVMANNEEGTENSLEEMAHNEGTENPLDEMEDNEGTQNASRGNDWEVVSLTASAYAAAPSPDQPELTNEENSGSVKAGGDTGTSDAMINSRHFVFPPSQHENLPLEPKNVEIGGEQEGGDDSHEEYGGKSDTKNEENLDINVPDVYSGIQGLDLDLVDKEQTFYDPTSFNSFPNESTPIEESTTITELTELIDQSLDSDISNIPDKDKYDESSLPCEAWWKRRAASIYGHAKEANALWSICIAAAVMGLVIIGQRWQLERWQVLQLKGQFGISDETISRMLRPLSRIKGVFVGGNRRGSFIKGSSSTER